MKSPPRLNDRVKKPYRLKAQLPPLQTNMIRNFDSYIDQAIAILDEAEQMRRENPKVRIKIDGGFGDYCLSQFRKKDQVKRQQDIPRLFTQTFRKRVNSCFPNNIDKELDEILERNKTIDVVAKSIENNSNQRKIPPFMVDLDGHLNYSFESTRQRIWVRSRLPSPTKSMKMTPIRQLEQQLSTLPDLNRNAKSHKLNLSRLPPKFKS